MQVPARLVVALLTLVALAAGGCGGGDGAATAMRRVLGGNRRYTRCLQDADADLAKAQACADLVGQ